MPLNLGGITRRTILAMASRLARHQELYRPHGSIRKSHDGDSRSRASGDRARDIYDRSRSRDGRSYDSGERSRDRYGRSRDVEDSPHERHNRSRDVDDRPRDRHDRSRDVEDSPRDRHDRSRDVDDISRDRHGRSRDVDDSSRDRHDRSRDVSDRSRDKRADYPRSHHRYGYAVTSEYSDSHRRQYREKQHRTLTDSRNDRYDSRFSTHRHSDSLRSGASLLTEIKKMLDIEHHHILEVIRNDDPDEAPQVVWCPRYIRPDMRGHVRGGTDLLHHRCRGCRRICLHLLGRPGTRRLCLQCSGFKLKKYIAQWYYHESCENCR